MLQWNELRVTPDARKLIIDVQVQKMPYYENVGIDRIVVDTQRSFDVTGPSNAPLFDMDGCGDNHIRIAVDIDSLGDNIFFVYAIAEGDPSCDTPCGMKDKTILGVVYNKYPFYKYAMSMLSEMDGCEPPQWLIDHILKLKAFEMCIKTGNYTKAIEYWDWFFNKKVRKNVDCGCHGKIKLSTL